MNIAPNRHHLAAFSRAVPVIQSRKMKVDAIAIKETAIILVPWLSLSTNCLQQNATSNPTELLNMAGLWQRKANRCLWSSYIKDAQSRTIFHEAIMTKLFNLVLKRMIPLTAPKLQHQFIHSLDTIRWGWESGKR